MNNDEKCRLCLSETNLMPLFNNYEQSNEYTTTLYVTTGLKIEPNDGLPQKICESCSKAVDSAIDLRNRSHLSQKQLLDDLDRKNKVNNIKAESPNSSLLNSNDINLDLSNDCEDFEGLRNSNIDEQNGAETKWPSVKKLSKKEKRQMYMKLVEGSFDPEGPVKCKICKNTVSKWRCFPSHVKLHLGFDFMCEFCGKSFINKTHLNRHCRSYHDMKRELKCNSCSYLALDNAQLKLHVRRFHTGERPYVCDTCSSSYYSRKCLVQHIESHRTVANVQCTSCSKMFKSHRALSSHRYTAHTHKRVQCPHCTCTYTRKYLRIHISKNHRDIITT